jgi:hypothetical protein
MAEGRGQKEEEDEALLQKHGYDTMGVSTE